MLFVQFKSWCQNSCSISVATTFLLRALTWFDYTVIGFHMVHVKSKRESGMSGWGQQYRDICISLQAFDASWNASLAHKYLKRRVHENQHFCYNKLTCVRLLFCMLNESEDEQQPSAFCFCFLTLLHTARILKKKIHNLLQWSWASTSKMKQVSMWKCPPTWQVKTGELTRLLLCLLFFLPQSRQGSVRGVFLGGIFFLTFIA